MFWKKSLSKRMKEEAVSLGLCSQWNAEWDTNASDDEVAEMFINGIEFCIDKNWPSVNTIKAYRDMMRRHGIYADDTVSLTNPKVVVLNGSTDANIKYEWMDSGEIYVRHNSILHLKAKGLSRVFVNLYDDAEIHVETEGSARVFVYQYGGKIIEANGDVTVRDRHNFKQRIKTEQKIV